MFRKLALGVSMVCLALALLFTFGDFGQGMLPAIICYFVGYVMLVIWQTGKWLASKVISEEKRGWWDRLAGARLK